MGTSRSSQTSEFFEEMDDSHELAENKIESESDKVKLWVEGDDDIPFWFAIFKKFAPQLKIEFEFHSISSGEEKNTQERDRKGKDFLLKQVKNNPEWVGCNKLICIDSDYDFLISTTKYAKIIRCVRGKRGPFIFQTYTYAIENYKCLAESLQFICVDTTYNADHKFDFVKFLKEYSQTIYDLFILSVYLKQEDSELKNVCSKDIIGLGDSWSIENNGAEVLEGLKEKVTEKMHEVYSENNIDNSKLDQIKNELKQKGVTPQNVYLFIDAHTLFDSVTKPILQGVTRNLRSAHHKRITGKIEEKNIDRSTSGNIHQNYEKDKIPALMLLKANKAHFYLDCPMLEKIKKDIDEYLDCCIHAKVAE